MPVRDQPMLRNTTALLAAILRKVAHGYGYWTSGLKPIDDFLPFVQGLHESYRVYQPHRGRQLAANLGATLAYLVIDPKPRRNKRDRLCAQFYILSTAPLPDQPCQEALYPGQRLLYRHYVLTNSTPTGRWTWRLTNEARAHYQERIRQAATANDPGRMRGLLTELSHLPRFHGIRRDLIVLESEARRAWLDAAKPRRRQDIRRPITWPKFSAQPSLSPSRVAYHNDSPQTLEAWIAFHLEQEAARAEHEQPERHTSTYAQRSGRTTRPVQPRARHSKTATRNAANPRTPRE